MSRLPLQLARATHRLGVVGGLGVALLIYAAALGALTLLPAREREAELQQRLAQREAALLAERQARARDAESSPEARLTHFYQAFPAQGTVPEWLERIYTLAGEQSLAVEQAQYKFTPEAGGRLARYEITLPASGGYPQLRHFIDRALAELPALGLRSIRLKRDGIDKENVDAALQFILFVRIG